MRMYWSLFSTRQNPLIHTTEKSYELNQKTENFVNEKLELINFHAIIGNYEKLNTKYRYGFSSFRAYKTGTTLKISNARTS